MHPIEKKEILTLIDAPDIRGKRVRSARMLSGLSRKQFHEKYKIHENTLKSWEIPDKDQTGLTEKGAYRFIEALKLEGISCSIDWLLFGKGGGPKLENIHANELILPEFPEISTDQDEAILREVQFFLDTNPNSVAVIISDNSMFPLYEIGDYIGGYKRTGENIIQFSNFNCIIQATDGTSYIGKYFPTEKPDLFRLIQLNCTSISSTIPEKLIEIDFVAPVVWHRKKDHFYKWS